METITIPMEEYKAMKADSIRLKKLEKIDWELVKSFKRGLEDLKAGRVKIVR